jgi:hypothetical protein
MLNSNIFTKPLDSSIPQSPFPIDVLVEPLHMITEYGQTLWT